MRRALAIGMRQINLLLIPAAAFLMVLATPVVRLIYQRGAVQRVARTHLTSIALFWFAFSLPFGGLNLLLTRTFFALKRPWIPTGLAGDEHRRRHHRVGRASTSRSASPAS